MVVQYSIQKMVSDGTLSTIALGIQYLQRNDIYMRVAGEETPQSGAPSGYTWSFLDNNTIRVLPVVPAGVEVVVYRRTDLDAMYNIYSQNAQFDESTIDENNQQLLYIAQEYFEQGVPAQLIESVDYVREDTANMYYRLKLSDGKYTTEFPIPKGGAAGFEALRRTYADAGLLLVEGSFETGGTLNSVTDVLLHNVTTKVYVWSGAFPHVVIPGTDPTAVGSGYVLRTDVVLRDELAGVGGAGLIGGLAKPVTWAGFAGGADNTGATPSDAAFAAASTSTAYVPDGTYQLMTDTPNGAWIVSDGVSFTGVGKLKGGLLKIGKHVTDYGGKPGGRWVNDVVPANIHRFNGRLLAGGSAKNNGLPLAAPGATSSWIDDPAVTGIIAGSLEQNAMAIAAVSDKGFNGLVTGVRASDAPFGASLGHTSVALQDRPTSDSQAVWSGYFVGIKAPSADSSNGVNNVEMNLWNQKSDADAGPIDPYNFFPVSNMNNLWLSNGFPEVEVSRPSYRATCAIGILNNVADTTKAKYRAGIAFKATALEGCDGVTGRGIAMALARGHSMQWYYGAGNAGPYITSNVDSNANGIQNLVFDNFGLLVRDTVSGSTQLRVEAKANPANHLRLSPSLSGQDVVVASDGSDSNINLRLMAKGTGNVLVGATLRPNTANTHSCGTSGSPWSGGFTQTAFTVTSDERYKTTPLEITDAMLDAMAEVNWVQYQYLDRIEAKGVDGARWHFGAIAQRVVEAFARHGLDAHEFGFICYDEWDANDAVLDEDGNAVTEAIEAGSRYGIRYEEALALEAALQRRNYQRLLARIEALEAK